jgi:hypothetical protein
LIDKQTDGWTAPGGFQSELRRHGNGLTEPVTAKFHTSAQRDKTDTPWAIFPRCALLTSRLLPSPSPQRLMSPESETPALVILFFNACVPCDGRGTRPCVLTSCQRLYALGSYRSRGMFRTSFIGAAPCSALPGYRCRAALGARKTKRKDEISLDTRDILRSRRCVRVCGRVGKEWFFVRDALYHMSTPAGNLGQGPPTGSLGLAREAAGGRANFTHKITHGTN